jgi:hypothetical protein
MILNTTHFKLSVTFRFSYNAMNLFFCALHLYMVTAVRVLGTANCIHSNTGDVHTT